MRGEWIEIFSGSFPSTFGLSSLPMRGEWIEIQYYAIDWNWCRWSLPMRGEWIEIVTNDEERLALLFVSPHAGRVD